MIDLTNIETADEYIDKLKELDFISDTWIDISKFLHEDGSINLEALELAVQHVVKTTPIIRYKNLLEYCNIRKIITLPSHVQEEINFIESITKGLAGEYYEGNDEICVLFQAETGFIEI